MYLIQSLLQFQHYIFHLLLKHHNTPKGLFLTYNLYTLQSEIATKGISTASSNQ